VAVGPAPPDGYHRIAGVVHVHTTRSDGGGTPEEVVAAARAAGLGFVAITDHNNLDAKPVEGYREGVLVIVGSELSTTSGHILGLGIPDPLFRFSGDAQDGLDDIHELGGIAFAAHPLSPREDFRFTGWDLAGPWGLELLNGDSEWRAAGWRLGLTAGLYRVNPRYALLRILTAPSETLARWDALLARRDVPGIVGADAHSRVPIRKNWSLRFPSYEALFAVARNYVLLSHPLSGDFEADEAAVLPALAKGRSYVGLDALCPADGFFFTAEAGAERWTMGDTVFPREGLVLRAGGRVPRGTRLTLVRDGRRVAENVDVLESAVSGPGVYRVEARVPGAEAPWVLTNPIYVFGPEAQAARRAAQEWPTPAPAPSPVAILDSFEGTTLFQPGAGDRSSVDSPALDPNGGNGGGGAFRLGFRLGEPTAEHPHPFCALVDWSHRDLRGRSGLVFDIRADRAYRIWVQVRDENQASADEGTEWWFASVRTSTTWRRVSVPFSRLRSINPKTDGRLDLDKVRAIVFVLDQGAVKAGTKGTIWVDNVGVY
jgi:hypothetical protein